ncbi:MAG: hypothetical protein DRG78_17275 [Epsilonproteobacteria bacterium]|nr:MAG: hypothetical protein DRG78_17275 [Campylobacterota bacterium]
MKTNLMIFIGVFFIAMLIFQTADVPSKTGVPESGKAKRIPCHKINTAFERGFGDEFIKTAQTQLESGNFKFSSRIEKATYAPSKLFNYVKLADIDKITQLELESYIIKKELADEKLRMSYYIYENDVGDPGKKTKKSKLYAGYVVYKFYNKKNKLIYQSQIDFMNRQGTDIAQSVKCAIRSFATFNKQGK